MNRRQLLTALAASPALMNLSDIEAYADSLPRTERMPAFFLGHGSPMNAIEENEFVAEMRRVGQRVPKPAAILCVSAHWTTRGTKVTAMDAPRTIHDFGGFPRALYEVQYPAPGDPQLAALAERLLAPTPVAQDQKWGLDHGAWSVIKHLYPRADVPVVQMSLDLTQPASRHLEIGGRLNALRDRGVLIIGSGNIVHNLRMIDPNGFDKVDHGYDWAYEAQALVNKQIQSGDFRPLADYQRLGPGGGHALRLAAPTPEHYLPLLYVLGMADPQQQPKLFNDKLVAGSISMTSVEVA